MYVCVCACPPQAQHRNKEGVLEFKKSEALKKAWKPFTFKVSASTYLLCFKTTDVSVATPWPVCTFLHYFHISSLSDNLCVESIYSVIRTPSSEDTSIDLTLPNTLSMYIHVILYILSNPDTSLIISLLSVLN